MDAGAERGDDRLYLGVLEHPVDPRLLDVDDLAADRQDRLEHRVAAGLRRATRGVTLDDVHLAAGGVVATGSRPACPATRRGRPRPCGATSSRALRAAARACADCDRLVDDCLRLGGLRSNQSASHSLQTRCTNDLASVLPSLVLVWPSNCGSLSLTDTIAARPSRMSSPESSGVLVLEQLLVARVPVHHSRSAPSGSPPRGCRPRGC